jgi:alkylhydroperoxidase family enzyme
VKEFERLPTRPAREAVAEAELDDFDFVDARTRKMDYHAFTSPAKYFEALMNAPELAAAIVRLGQVIRGGQVRGTYSDAERELVDMVLATDMGCNAIFTVHIPDAIAVGVRPEAIEAIRKGHEEDLTDDERHIAAYTREVVSGGVTDDSYARMAQRLGPRGALEFTAFIAILLMIIRLWQALGVPEPTDAEIDELFQGLLDGSVPTPHPTARIG